MSVKISAICDTDDAGLMLMKAAKELNIDLKYEVQKDNVIINELSDE